jgi:hypothetical protein
MIVIFVENSVEFGFVGSGFDSVDFGLNDFVEDFGFVVLDSNPVVVDFVGFEVVEIGFD